MAATGLRRAMMAGAALALLAACAPPGPRGNGAPVTVRGSEPRAVAVPGVNATGPVPELREIRPGTPDADGIVLYDGYAAVVARDGDTVQSVAARIGLSATELGAYNGLTAASPLRRGDELVLPPRPGGWGTTVATAPDAGTYPPTPDPSLTGLPGTSGPITASPLGGGPAPDPLAGSGRPEAPPAAPDPATTGGWSPTRIAEAIERGASAPGTAGVATPIPGTPAPIPGTGAPETGLAPGARPLGTIPAGPGTTPAPGPDLASATPAEPPVAAPSGGARLLRPVEGTVALGYNQGTGPAKNDGVDFAAPAGAPVVAAESGTVALVSQSLGGLGTIVLIRHDGGLLTVYGRISDVSVSKGDPVSRGQRIGAVANAAPPAEPRMHFEVRRGAESVDPMQFL